MAVIYDLAHDQVREVPLDIGLRSEICDVENVGGTMWFYLCFLDAPNHWAQIVTDDAREHSYTVKPESREDDALLWDLPNDRLVRFEGDSANPQSLLPAGGVQLYYYKRGSVEHHRILYEDGHGQPAFFHGKEDGG